MLEDNLYSDLADAIF